MKKTLRILIILISASSCRPFLDYAESIHSDSVEFNYMEDYNEFVYKSKVYATADNEVYYPNHFSLNLPKRLKNWLNLGNEFYFEYPGKEIIYLNVGFKNIGDSQTWQDRETNNDEIFSSVMLIMN